MADLRHVGACWRAAKPATRRPASSPNTRPDVQMPRCGRKTTRWKIGWRGERTASSACRVSQARSCSVHSGARGRDNLKRGKGHWWRGAARRSIVSSRRARQSSLRSDQDPVDAVALVSACDHAARSRAAAMPSPPPHEAGSSAIEPPTEAPGAPTPDATVPDVPALHLAAQHGDLAQIQTLLDEGTSPNLRDSSEITALVCGPAGQCAL